MKSTCDIILLSYESPELLKKCVASVFENTSVKSRLIIVDNASKDPEVKRYLGEVSGNDTVSVEKVFSEENAGFAGGINKGMRLSDAPFVCLLNNDCVVAPGWLDEMIRVAELDVRIGLVNPQSNTFGSSAEGGMTIKEHAETIADKKGEFVELGHAIGFACLIKRQVIEKIGYLDEIYQGVCYEDTDYSVRAKKSGFIPVMAEASYVFHKEQASRGTLKGKKEIYARNRKIFENKWGRTLRVLYFDSSVKMPENHGEVAKDYDMLKSLAREGAIIDFLVSGKKSASLYGKDIARHADLHLLLDGGRFTAFRTLWRVLTKKKKYDAVILDNPLLAGALRLLMPVRGGKVFDLDEKGIIRCGRGNIFSLTTPGGFTDFIRKSDE